MGICNLSPKHPTANTHQTDLSFSFSHIYWQLWQSVPFWECCSISSGSTRRGWLFWEGSISTKREPVSFGNLAEMYWGVGELLLDTPDGLDLAGLGVRSPLSPVLVVPTVVVKLQDVLVATVPGILVAHPAGRKGQRGKQGGVTGCPPPTTVAQMTADCPCCSWSLGCHLRATLDLHGAHFVVGPAHGLQRGVVVSNLPLAADEVVFLEDGDLGFLVILRGRAGGEGEVVLPPQRGWEWQSCHSLRRYSEGSWRGRCSGPGCLEFSGWLGGVSCATATISGWLSPSSSHIQLAQKFPQKL